MPRGDGFEVYIGCRPDESPCYIGKGHPRSQRIYNHNRSLRRGDHCNRYLQATFDKYGAIEWTVLRSGMTETEAFETEKALIAHFGRGKGRLTNLSDGGEGPSGLVVTAEGRQRMSASQKLRVRTPEEIRRLTTHNIGKKHSAETIAKMRAAALGKKKSPESIAKRSATRTGRKESAETCARKSASAIRTSAHLNFRAASLAA